MLHSIANRFVYDIRIHDRCASVLITYTLSKIKSKEYRTAATGQLLNVSMGERIEFMLVSLNLNSQEK